MATQLIFGFALLKVNRTAAERYELEHGGTPVVAHVTATAVVNSPMDVSAAAMQMDREPTAPPAQPITFTKREY
jgi:hypothetical protein